MKKCIQSIMVFTLFAAFSTGSYSQTTITGGDVYGIWTAANSPYLITGNITIPADSSLVIEPGCYIEFKSSKSLTVTGFILAIGTQNDSIVFTVEGGSSLWAGIFFLYSYNQDTSCFKYCRIEKGAKSYPNPNGGLFSICNSANIHIENCELKHGSASGGGGAIFTMFVSNILIKNNLIHHCSVTQRGGAILIGGQSNHCFIVSNRITSNIADYGGAIYISDASPKIINNIFDNNHANFGGVMGMIDAYWEPNGYYYFTNNTMAHNYASVAGPGIWMLDATLGIYNCIFYHNYGPTEPHQIYLAEWGNPYFYNCAIEGGLTGISTIDSIAFPGIFENCIEANPWAIGNIDNPYMLTAGSPCINAGIILPELEIPDYDFAGNNRIVMDSIDIGAYEFQVISRNSPEYHIHEFKAFPNPTAGMIRLTIPETNEKSSILELFSITGQKLETYIVQTDNPELNLSGIKKGIYFLRLKTDQKTYTQKIIIR
jgi:hypothetical protein